MSSPRDFNLPPQFSSWRPGQEKLIQQLLSSPKRFSFVEAPVGSGKTVVHLALAASWPSRAVVLTATKGLQDQIERDFGAMDGFADVRGMNNYTCIELDRRKLNEMGGPRDTVAGKGCDMGPCRQGQGCDYRNVVLDPAAYAGDDCPPDPCFYYKAWAKAKDARIVSTNYAYWMGVKEYGRGLGDNIGLLILDEGHDADRMLRGFLGVTVGWKKVEMAVVTTGVDAPAEGAGPVEWRDWAVDVVKELDRRKGMDEDSELADAKSKVRRLSMLREDWWFEVNPSLGVQASPSRVSQHAEHYLFRGIPRIVVLSGTLRPEHGRMLGVGESDMDYIICPSSFDPKRRPFYYIPTIRANYKATESDWRKWLDRIDTIIRARTDRKGVIHTVSYARAQYIKANSRFKDMMLLHGSGQTQRAVEQFKASPNPCILLSPSITTGYDFLDDHCRYQIIAKLPYSDTRNGVESVLNARIKNWTSYTAAQIISQAYGRGCRSQTDFCENFILDDSWKWFVKSHKALLPAFLLEAVKMVDGPPLPLELE